MRSKGKSKPPDFGTATPSFGPAVKLDLEAIGQPVNLSRERSTDDPDSPAARKHGNKKVYADGYTFDSEVEYGEYLRLKLAATCGAITELRVHPPFELIVNGVLVATYSPDFTYYRGGIWYVVDVKSAHTRTLRRWTVIKKLFRACYGFDVTEVVL